MPADPVESRRHLSQLTESLLIERRLGTGAAVKQKNSDLGVRILLGSSRSSQDGEPDIHGAVDWAT